MGRDEFIKKLEELDRVLLEEMPVEEITDHAREQAHYNLENLIDIIKENEEAILAWWCVRADEGEIAWRD